MRHKLTLFLDSAITFVILILAGLTPLLFFNQTTEFFNMPKLILLFVSTIVLVGLWILSWIVKGKVVINRTPLDFPLLFLLVVVLVSTFYSTSRFSSIYGNFPNVHESAVAWITYILLYFVTVSHLKTLKQAKTLLTVLYIGAGIVAFISLLAFFHIYLPFSFAKAVNFTPTGSTFSTYALLTLLLPLPLLSLINPNKYMPYPLAAVITILFGAIVILTGSLPIIVVLAFTVILCLFVSDHQQIRKALPLFLIPVVVLMLVAFAAYLPLPGVLSKVNKLETAFPKEVQLPLAISWKISASAFRDSPFIGTGPSTYLFNFTSYKPSEYNQLKFWNFSFETAYNEFLQIFATMGILGFTAFALLCLVVLNISRKNLTANNSANNPEIVPDASAAILPALAISGLIAVVLLLIHATTLVSLVSTLFVFAVFMMSQKTIRDRVMEFSIGLKASTSDNRQFDLFPIIVFVIFLIAAVPVLLRTSKVVAADYYHRKALAQANKNGTLTYQYLQKAEAYSPFIDLYRVDMAQTNFALANAIAAKAGTKQSSPAATLTAQEVQTIQTLLSQAINEGRAAVTLSPRSSRNWEVLASVYRNIAGVAKNSLTFSLDAYGRAIQRDPLNPALRVNVGGIYYSVKNYDLAIRFFTDAANLKPDYVNAYYNLAIALREKGDFQNGAAVANQAVALLAKDPQSADYKAASALLDDLKSKVAKTSTAQPAQTAPAAQTNSALGNQNLPEVKVSDLNNPPQVTPVAPVKPNPEAGVPQVIPTAAVQPTSAPVNP